MSTKPTVVFVPGAWHSPTVFSLVASRLEAAGYTTRSVTLESVDATITLENFDPDVSTIRHTIESVLGTTDQDVLLFMHSYGSVPANEACKGLDKSTRRKDGHRNGISHLFFCCAFVLAEKVSLIDALGGEPLPWFDISTDGKVVHAATPEKVFYNDLDEEDKERWSKELRPHSYRTFFSKVRHAAWRHVPSTYLYCERDMALPIEVQKEMIGGQKGAKFETESVEAGHSPFLSVPDMVVGAVRRAAGETL